MKQPLDGIKILDLSRYLPGPFATQFLADFGAEVIKIEEPGGELGRALPPFAGGMGTRFASVNRNKKSITLDLKKDEARKIFMKLSESADVVVDQFRPGVMDKLGLGYESLKRINKGIVYCSITGYGLSGPWMKAAGHDVNYLNISGVSGLTAGVKGPRVVISADCRCGRGEPLCVIGISSCDLCRTRTGEGQSLRYCNDGWALSLLSYTIGEWTGNRKCPSPGREFLTGGFAMYNVYRCSDSRYVGLGAIEQKFWHGFCEGIGRSEYIPLQYSIEKQEDIIADISEIMLTKSRDEWVEHFRNKDICFTPVLDLDEVSEHEQVRAREMMLKVMDSWGAKLIPCCGEPG
jgi:crotonobetainyl-CoA:carnitine CoA-transferase CaiB-like acyl-CoA transferase